MRMRTIFQQKLPCYARVQGLISDVHILIRSFNILALTFLYFAVWHLHQNVFNVCTKEYAYISAQYIEG